MSAFCASWALAPAATPTHAPETPLHGSSKAQAGRRRRKARRRMREEIAKKWSDRQENWSVHKSGCNHARLRAVIKAVQLATLVDEAPEGDEWLHEQKFDGYRIIAEKR